MFSSCSPVRVLAAPTIYFSRLILVFLSPSAVLSCPFVLFLSPRWGSVWLGRFRKESSWVGVHAQIVGWMSLGEYVVQYLLVCVRTHAMVYAFCPHPSLFWSSLPRHTTLLAY